ncbi:MAG: hypothetical protein KGJ66_13040 [Alphaproteobacteria bacterium]|nr:hypothetical protein [Alphaproteobacteria bacterium]
MLARRAFRPHGLWPATMLLVLAACAGQPAAIAPGASTVVTTPDAQNCPRGVVPAARIAFASRPPRFDDTASLAQLSREGDLAFGRVALGLTEVKLSLDAQYRIRHAPGLTGGICAYPADVVLHLGYAMRVVHVAREFADQPCLHAAILAHEMRHVALDDALIPREAARLGQALSARIGDGAGFWGRDAADADRRSAHVIAQAGAATVNALGAARRRAHAQRIDTPAEEARIGAACGGRLRQLLDRTP